MQNADVKANVAASIVLAARQFYHLPVTLRRRVCVSWGPGRHVAPVAPKVIECS